MRVRLARYDNTSDIELNTSLYVYYLNLMEGIDDTIWELCHVCLCIDNFGPCIHYLWPLLIPARKLHGEDSNDNDDDFKDNHYFWSPTCTPYLPHPYFCCRIFREVIENDDKYGGPVFILLQELCSCEAYDWSWRGYNVRRSSPPIVKGCGLGSTMNKTCFNTPPICFTPPPSLLINIYGGVISLKP